MLRVGEDFKTVAILHHQRVFTRIDRAVPHPFASDRFAVMGVFQHAFGRVLFRTLRDDRVIDELDIVRLPEIGFLEDV